MDFSNEYYVRIYVRDTTTWKRLGWDGQSVLVQLLRKMDVSGVLDIEDMDPWEAVVLHCGAPEASARAGSEAVLRLGCIVHNGSQLVAPKYREANEARKSDAQRQREFRLRDAVTRRDGAVTKGDETVTAGHTPSQSVTVGHSFPSVSPSENPSESIPSPNIPPALDPEDFEPYAGPKIKSPEGQLWDVWCQVAANGNPMGSMPRAELCGAWEACKAKSPSDVHGEFRKAAETFVAAQRAKGKPLSCRWLCNDIGQYLYTQTAKPVEHGRRRKELT